MVSEGPLGEHHLDPRERDQLRGKLLVGPVPHPHDGPLVPRQWLRGHHEDPFHELEPQDLVLR